MWHSYSVYSSERGTQYQSQPANALPPPSSQLRMWRRLVLFFSYALW